MDDRAFEHCLDRYGSDLEAWPVEVRHRAESLMAASAAARRSHADLRSAEQVVRAMVTRLGEAPPLARIASRPQVRRSSPLPLRAGLACAFAGVLAAGFLVGDALAGRTDTPEHTLQAAFSTTETLDVE